MTLISKAMLSLLLLVSFNIATVQGQPTEDAAAAAWTPPRGVIKTGSIFPIQNPVAAAVFGEVVLGAYSACAGWAPRTTGAITLFSLPLGIGDMDWENETATSMMTVGGFAGLGIYNVAASDHPEGHFKLKTFEINLAALNALVLAEWGVDALLHAHQKKDAASKDQAPDIKIESNGRATILAAHWTFS